MTETGASSGGFAVVLAAAGSGTRFGSGENSGRKQFMELGGRPLFTWSLDAFASISEVRVVCVVAPAEELEAVGELVKSWSKGCPRAAGQDLAISLVSGGQSRQESVRLGVEAIGETCEWILVHDAARPLIEPEDVRRLMAAVSEHGAAALGYPATDSVKREEAGMSEQGLDRSRTWSVQTPQGATAENFREAYSLAAEGEKYTDELALLEAAGIPARLVEGSRENIKVTLPGDEELARFFLSRRDGAGGDD
tara:strand:+ start:242 stop:997 length:756 start_codon:yes stop_codon:yes gene_type:complete